MSITSGTLIRRPRLLIADDHALLREAFQKLLEADCDIVGSVADGRSLVTLAPKVNPDVILLDIAMPLLNGVDAALQLKRAMPLVKLIVLTVNEDPDLATEALRIGASGYLLKSCAAMELFDAIRTVLQGKRYITPLMTKNMMQSFIHSPHRESAKDLTLRQREVLQLLTEGCSMKEVAAIMNITPRTVAFHKYRIMEEFRLKTSAELIQFAMRRGFTTGSACPCP